MARGEPSSPGMRTLLVTLVLAFVGLLAVDLEPSAAPRQADTVVAPKVVKVAPATVEVAFLRNGRIVRVERVVPKGAAPPLHALRELVQGPTRAERAKGIRTAFRPGVRPRFVEAVDDLWLVRLSRSFLGPATPETMRTRLAQIGATLAQRGPQRYAAISAEGRLVTTLRLGMRPEAWRPEEGELGYDYSTRGVQLRLWTLGYIDRLDLTGALDYATEQALLAFQGWEDLDRTGTVTGQTQVALFRALRPRPNLSGDGRRVEIHRDLGVLLMVEDGEVARVVHTSTGAGGVTPVGSFRVYQKALMSWSVPFEVWMPYAAYFRGGIATHQSPDVPSYPASHGCVRLPEREAERVYRFVDVGTPVHVF